MPWKSRFLKLNITAAVFIFCIPALLYLYTLSPTISVGDSPELTASALILGIGHPPGYPLYMLLGKGISLIPTGGHISYKINLLSAVLGGVSAFFLYLSILEVFGLLRQGAPYASRYHGITAFLGALVFAVSPIFWSQSVVSEVYALNSALFIGLLWLGLRWTFTFWDRGNGQESNKNNPQCSDYGLRILYLISFLWGLSLGNHHTMIAFGPIFSLFAVIQFTIRGSDLSFLRCISLISFLIFFFLLGLSVYLYLPIRSGQNPFIDWGDAERLGGFIEVVLRKQFGLGSRDYSFERSLMQVGYYLAMLREQFTLPGLFLGGTGLFFFLSRKPWLSLFTLSLFLTHGLITTLFLNPASTDFNAMDVMVIPSFAVFSVWIGIGLLFACRSVVAVFTKRLTEGMERNIVITITAAFLLIPATLLYLNFSKNNQRYNTFAYDYAKDIFMGIEPNGVLFVDTDLSLFPLWYMQYVEGVRRDVAVLNVDMLMLPWFKMQLKRKYPAVDIRIPDVMRHSKGKGFRPLSMEALESYKVSQVEDMLDSIMDKHPVYLSYDFGIPFKEFVERKDIHIIRKGITFRILKEKATEEDINNPHTLKSILKAIESGDEAVLFIARGYISAMEKVASREFVSGDRNRAAKWMEAILTVDPYNVASLNNLAFLYAEDGRNLHKAEQMVKMALSRDPNGRKRYLKTLGYIYLKKGKYREAGEAFTKVLEMEPDSEWTRQKLEESSKNLSLTQG